MGISARAPAIGSTETASDGAGGDASDSEDSLSGADVTRGFIGISFGVWAAKNTNAPPG